jgi:hypothetical protein
MLESQPKHQLELPRRSGSSCSRIERLRDPAKAPAGRKISIRQSKLSSIKQVERLGAEFQPNSLRDLIALSERRIDLPDPRRTDKIAAGVSPRAVGRNGKRRWIDPQTRCLARGRDHRNARHKIRPLRRSRIAVQERSSAASYGNGEG